MLLGACGVWKGKPMADRSVRRFEFTVPDALRLVIKADSTGAPFVFVGEDSPFAAIRPLDQAFEKARRASRIRGLRWKGLPPGVKRAELAVHPETLRALAQTLTNTELPEDDVVEVDLVADPEEVSRERMERHRLSFVIDSVGGASTLARLLGVHRSQPSRWVRGQESPSPRNARAIEDIDYIIGRARAVWTKNVAQTWLDSSNSFLDGRTPVSVLLDEGPSPVIEALDHASQGGFS